MEIDQHHVLLFIAYCFHKQMAAATVSTYISALSNLLKMKDLPDVKQLFIVKKALQGYHKLIPRTDSILPFTYAIIRDLVGLLD